jgi:hypothetical protein
MPLTTGAGARCDIAALGEMGESGPTGSSSTGPTTSARIPSWSTPAAGAMTCGCPPGAKVYVSGLRAPGCGHPAFVRAGLHGDRLATGIVVNGSLTRPSVKLAVAECQRTSRQARRHPHLLIDRRSPGELPSRHQRPRSRCRVLRWLRARRGRYQYQYGLEFVRPRLGQRQQWSRR